MFHFGQPRVADRNVRFCNANNLLRLFLVQEGYLLFSQTTYIPSTLVRDGEREGNGRIRRRLSNASNDQIGEQQKDRETR